MKRFVFVAIRLPVCFLSALGAVTFGGVCYLFEQLWKLIERGLDWSWGDYPISRLGERMTEEQRKEREA